MRLIEGNQFDTIYHEHFSYFSLLTAETGFRAHGLKLIDVEELPTHGGSIRIFGQHAGSGGRATTGRYAELRGRELRAGYDQMATYSTFGERCAQIGYPLLPSSGLTDQDNPRNDNSLFYHSRTS